jgi:hypothetical protein
MTRMTGSIRARKLALNVIPPRRMNTHTDSELKLMLVTLKNAMVVDSLDISRSERELKERGTDSRILSSSRIDSLSELDEIAGDAE